MWRPSLDGGVCGAYGLHLQAVCIASHGARASAPRLGY